jgi:undecaprenyl-diphosphatase
MTFLQLLVLAVVEGLTEFLPVSSTGHMALVSAFLGIEKDSFTTLFIENIQFGAIISVILIYWRKFFDFRKLTFYVKLLVAFIPAAIVGVLLKKHIDEVLKSPLFITVVMILGGVILLFVDNWFKHPSIETEEKITMKNSFAIGIFQLLAVVFPGFSRSAATIIGGMQQKLTRKAAAEFSFFLAVPTLAGAFAKSLWDAHKETPELLNNHNLLLLLLGNLFAFIVAIIAIKAFIAFLTRYGFRLFGYYRIIIGLAILMIIIFGGSIKIL